MRDGAPANDHRIRGRGLNRLPLFNQRTVSAERVEAEIGRRTIKSGQQPIRPFSEKELRQPPVPAIRDGAWAMPQIHHAMAPRSLHIRSRSPLDRQDRARRSPSDAMRWFR
jgi:hypothetical protein